MKLLKYAVLFVVVAIGAAVVGVGGWYYSCQGRMSDCYASYRSFTRGADNMSERRRYAMNGGLAASASSVAFPFPLAGNGDGILVLDHDKDRPKLISTAGYAHWSPRFSVDGNRLVFFRMATGGHERELLSCEVSTWRCAILFRSPNAMMSAVDIGNGEVLFSMNARRTNDPENRRRFDVFAIRKGGDLMRLTNYEAYELHSLSVGGGKLVFGAAGRNFSTTGACQPDNHRDCDKSEIFALDFDPSMPKVIDGAGPLKPLFSVTGSSVKPIVSSDGKRIAFLNTNRAGGTWRYNFAFGNIDGHVDGGLPARGIYFSPGAFAGDELFVNELFEDRYRIYRLDLKMKRVAELEIKHSPENIASFEPITLTIEGQATRAAGL